MKNFILCLGLFILLCTPSYGQSYMAEYSEYIGKAEALYTKKEYIELELRQTHEYKLLQQQGMYFPTDFTLNIQKDLKL